MKRLTTLLAMTWMLTALAVAQEQKRTRFSPEEFKARMENYIAQKAGLTQSESEAVFPLFMEMKAKQRQLMQKEMKLKHSKQAPDSDKECQEALNEVMSVHIESAKVEATYYKKMCKAISPQKVYAIMLADNAFHREMLQHFNNSSKGKNSAKGKP